MAGSSSQSKASARRSREAADSRRLRILVIATIVVLSASAVLAGIGVYVGVYLPPRAHVLTVDDHEYDAGEFMRRARYFALYEGGALQGLDRVVDGAIAQLEREAKLRRDAPGSVGEVTEADMDAELRERLGFAEEGVDESGYGSALGSLLRVVDMPRDEFNRILEAQILEGRLRVQFETEIGDSAPQVQLRSLRVGDRALAERLREEALTTDDFHAVAVRESLDDGAAAATPTWQAVEALDERIRDAVKDLKPGAVSAVVEATPFYEIYYLEDRANDRELDETLTAQLVATRLGQWLDAAAPPAVEHAMSNEEYSWIVERVSSAVANAQRGG